MKKLIICSILLTSSLSLANTVKGSCEDLYGGLIALSHSVGRQERVIDIAAEMPQFFNDQAGIDDLKAQIKNLERLYAINANTFLKSCVKSNTVDIVNK